MINQICFIYNNKNIIVSSADVEWFNYLNEEYIDYNAGAEEGKYFGDLGSIDDFYLAHNTDDDLMHCIADNARLLAIAFDVGVFVGLNKCQSMINEITDKGIIKEIRATYNNKNIVVTKEDVELYNHIMDEWLRYADDDTAMEDYYAMMGADEDKRCCIDDNLEFVSLAFRMKVA